MLVVFVCVIAATVGMFGIVPKGFIPDTDNDSLNVNMQAAQGTSYYEMVGYAQKVIDVIRQNPYVEAQMVNVGGGGPGGPGGGGNFNVQLDAARQPAVVGAADRAAAARSARPFPGIPRVRERAGGAADRRLPRQQQLQPERPEPQLRRAATVGSAPRSGDGASCLKSRTSRTTWNSRARAST